MEKNYRVTKSNKLICANYDLSVQEQKIILTLASMVQPEDTEFKEYEFKIKEFMQLLGISTKTKYKEIPKITKDLMKKVFEVKEGKDILQLSWLSSVRYKTGEGIVILKFDSNLKPYMLDLKELYTSYKLDNILSLKSKYSLRLYELLKSNYFKKKVTIKLEELKDMVGANANYLKVYADFKNKVIFQAQKELAEKTDISFEFEEVKTGRKITGIKFYIKTNNDRMSTEHLLLTTSENEVSATLTESEEENLIKKIIDIMHDSKITALEAKKLNDTSNGDINKIKEKYVLFQNSNNIDSVVGWMLRAIKDDYRVSKEKVEAGKFNDYEQRDYDFDKLEKKLLGWDNNEKDVVGEEYQQLLRN